MCTAAFASNRETEAATLSSAPSVIAGFALSNYEVYAIMIVIIEFTFLFPPMYQGVVKADQRRSHQTFLDSSDARRYPLWGGRCIFSHLYDLYSSCTEVVKHIWPKSRTRRILQHTYPLKIISNFSASLFPMRQELKGGEIKKKEGK